MDSVNSVPNLLSSSMPLALHTGIGLQMLARTKAWIQTACKDPLMRNSGWLGSAPFKHPILVSSLTEWIRPGGGCSKYLVNNRVSITKKNSSTSIGSSCSSSWDSEYSKNSQSMLDQLILNASGTKRIGRLPYSIYMKMHEIRGGEPHWSQDPSSRSAYKCEESRCILKELVGFLSSCVAAGNWTS